VRGGDLEISQVGALLVPALLQCAHVSCAFSGFLVLDLGLLVGAILAVALPLLGECFSCLVEFSEKKGSVF
jgi:hypothetical protein